jgi:alkylation response protein AidB-like acyl-CoA dehydrogenase
VGDWSIEDTWYVAGLAGTGSHHIALRDSFVPDEHFFNDEGQSCLSGPLYKSVLETLTLIHNAFAVGVAEGALADITGLANSGRQQQRAPTRMRESELFQYELGRTAAELKAARAFHQVRAASLWCSSLRGTQSNAASLAGAHQSAVWVNEACTRVVDACFALGGGGVIYSHAPLQRRLRDIHVAGQHYAVQRRHYSAAGQSLLQQAE